MSSRASAFHYAKGLFSVAVEAGDVRAIAADLERFAQLVAGNEELRRALTLATVPPARKQAVVARVLDATGAAPLVRHFLLLVARQDHVALLPAIVEVFEARVMAHFGIERAEVVTAVPLTAAEQEQMARSLSKATGKQVQVSTRVDASLLGGAVARVGSLVFDGSVKRQLERVREELAAGH